MRPGDSGIPGNKKADKQRILNSPLDKTIYSYPIIKKQIVLEWENDSNANYSQRQSMYSKTVFMHLKILVHVNIWNIIRGHLTTIILIKTGHSLSRYLLLRIGIQHDPYCECGPIIILKCPINITRQFYLFQDRRLNMKNNRIKQIFPVLGPLYPLVSVVIAWTLNPSERSTLLCCVFLILTFVPKV